MVAPCGASVTVVREEPLYVTFRRLEFDRALVERPRALGAEVTEGARVVGVVREAAGVTVYCADGRRFRARLVVAADGVHSVVGARWDWPRRTGRLPRVTPRRRPPSWWRRTRRPCMWRTAMGVGRGTGTCSPNGAVWTWV